MDGLAESGRGQPHLCQAHAWPLSDQSCDPPSRGSLVPVRLSPVEEAQLKRVREAHVVQVARGRLGEAGIAGAERSPEPSMGMALRRHRTDVRTPMAPPPGASHASLDHDLGDGAPARYVGRVGTDDRMEHRGRSGWRWFVTSGDGEPQVHLLEPGGTASTSLRGSGFRAKYFVRGCGATSWRGVPRQLGARVRFPARQRRGSMSFSSELNRHTTQPSACNMNPCQPRSGPPSRVGRRSTTARRRSNT